MLINQIINVDEDFESGDITEPVTLQQVKNYLRLEGFVSDDSGEQEFDFDDTLIEAMITEGRMWAEKFTGQYLVPRILNVVLLNQAGKIELPGPVIGSIVLTDSEADEIDSGNYDFIGTTYPKLETTFDSRITATYQAGFTVFPAWVVNTIKAYVAWAYEHRGDDELPGSPIRAAAIARPYRRVKAWG